MWKYVPYMLKIGTYILFKSLEIIKCYSSTIFEVMSSEFTICNVLTVKYIA